MMASTNLLLTQPLSLDEIGLGLFVTSLDYPKQEYVQPDAVCESAKKLLTNLNHVLDTERGMKLKVSLLDMLSASPASRSNLNTSLSSHTFTSYQLHKSDTYFRHACSEPAVREFLQTQAQRLFGKVFVVCGYKTLQDAHVNQSQGGSGSFEGGLALPASVVASAAAMAGGVPLPPIVTPESDIDLLAIKAERDTKMQESAQYDAPGEQVFAVQFRRVKFSWFSAKDASAGASLETGNRWKLYGYRGEGDQDGIEADLDGFAAPTELVGSGDYGVVDLDGEEFVIRTQGVEEEEEL